MFQSEQLARNLRPRTFRFLNLKFLTFNCLPTKQLARDLWCGIQKIFFCFSNCFSTALSVTKLIDYCWQYFYICMLFCLVNYVEFQNLTFVIVWMYNNLILAVRFLWSATLWSLKKRNFWWAWFNCDFWMLTTVCDI